MDLRTRWLSSIRQVVDDKNPKLIAYVYMRVVRGFGPADMETSGIENRRSTRGMIVRRRDSRRI